MLAVDDGGRTRRSNGHAARVCEGVNEGSSRDEFWKSMRLAKNLVELSTHVYDGRGKRA